MSIWNSLLEALIPSQQSGESAATYRWRQIVAASILIMAVSIMVTNALIWGVGQPFYPGFAGKTQLNAVQTQVNDIRLDQITRNLKDAKTAECVAQQQGNMVALKFAQDEVQTAYDAYFAITKIAPRIPGCDELVLATPQAPRSP